MARDTKKGAMIWRVALVLSALIVAGVSTAMAGLKVRDYVLSDPRFTLPRDHARALSVDGLQYAPRAKVQRIFTADFENSIFAIPIDERRRRLLAIDWVEDASVSRIWPNRLVVRIRERKPVA